MYVQVVGQIFGMGHAAFHVAKILPQLIFLAQHIHVVPFGGPSDSSQDHGLNAGVHKVLIPVAGYVNEGPVGLAAGKLVLIGPDLRLDVVNVHASVFGDVFSGSLLGFLIATALGIDCLGRVGGG